MCVCEFDNVSLEKVLDENILCKMMMIIIADRLNNEAIFSHLSKIVIR
jgi:hypothetical protein